MKTNSFLLPISLPISKFTLLKTTAKSKLQTAKINLYLKCMLNASQKIILITLLSIEMDILILEVDLITHFLVLVMWIILLDFLF